MTDEPAPRTVDALLVDILEQLADLATRVDDLERSVAHLEREDRQPTKGTPMTAHRFTDDQRASERAQIGRYGAAGTR